MPNECKQILKEGLQRRQSPGAREKSTWADGKVAAPILFASFQGLDAAKELRLGALRKSTDASSTMAFVPAELLQVSFDCWLLM